MRTLEMADAIAPLATYAENISSEPVIVMSNGKPIAALVTLENIDFETLTLSTNLSFIALIERSRKRQNAEGGFSADEMRHGQ